MADLQTIDSATVSAAVVPAEKSISPKKQLSTTCREMQAYNLRLSGIPVAEIAVQFSVTPDTVYRWLSSVSKQHRDFLQEQTPSEVVADALLFYDHVEQMYLNEVNYLNNAGRRIDPVTGELEEVNEGPRRVETRMKCITGAMAARKNKIDLMLGVGILPRDDPGRLYKDWKGRSEESSEEVETNKTERSPEDIKKNIMRLLQNCRTIS